jgi:S-phase kinase-associated protein 1
MVKCQLQCMSGKVFTVEKEVIEKSIIIKDMLADLGIGEDTSVEVDEEIIPLPSISEKSMEKVIDWCEHHKADPPPAEDEEDFIFNEEIGDWDKEFLKMDDGTLFDLILAANYLDIKGLLDVTTTHVAQIIVECRTPEKIRERFNIKNDLTPEDLEQIKYDAEHWMDSENEELAGSDDEGGDRAGTSYATGGTTAPPRRAPEPAAAAPAPPAAAASSMMEEDPPESAPFIGSGDDDDDDDDDAKEDDPMEGTSKRS